MRTFILYFINDAVIAAIFFSIGYLFYPMLKEHKDFKRKVKSMMKEFEKQDNENEI